MQCAYASFLFTSICFKCISSISSYTGLGLFSDVLITVEIPVSLLIVLFPLLFFRLTTTAIITITSVDKRPTKLVNPVEIAMMNSLPTAIPLVKFFVEAASVVTNSI